MCGNYPGVVVICNGRLCFGVKQPQIMLNPFYLNLGLEFLPALVYCSKEVSHERNNSEFGRNGTTYLLYTLIAWTGQYWAPLGHLPVTFVHPLRYPCLAKCQLS
jgi:hypothetical protein